MNLEQTIQVKLGQLAWTITILEAQLSEANEKIKELEQTKEKSKEE